MAQIIQTTFQFKRGDAEKWNELNPILAEGEPGVELDTNKFKIGNGINTWKELPYKGEANIVNAQTRNDFPAHGNENTLYKAQGEKLLYQWNPNISAYEVLGTFGEADNGSSIIVDTELSISSMNPVANKVITMALQDFAEDHYTKKEVDTAIENTNKRIDLLKGTTHFRGTYPDLNDETLNADLYEFSAGDIFIVENAEYICTTSGNLVLLEKAKYEKLGDGTAEAERISALEEKVGNEQNGEIEATGLYRAIVDLENNKLDKTDLNNYYSKDETYTTDEIDSLVQEIDNREEVTTLRELVDTIIGDDVGLSMRMVAVAVVAEIVGKAPEAFDTLEEIATWIEAHPDDVAAIVKRISDLETSISTKIDKKDIINTLDSTALDKPLSAAMGKELNSLIKELETNIDDGYVKQTELTDAINTALRTAKEGGEFDGQDGGHYTPSVKDNGNGTMTITFAASKSDMPSVNPITISLPVPEDGKDGDNGDDGGYYIPSINTISNNEFKISFTASKSGMPSVGDVTITLPTANDGDDGVGIESVVQTTTSSADNGENVITVTLTNGSTSTFKVKNGSKGSKGDAGNGIKSIAKTSTSGLVDTYTITFTDNTTTIFTVTNGKAGTNGTSVSVSSVTESTASEGLNVVKFSDGKTLTVKNGKDGADFNHSALTLGIYTDGLLYIFYNGQPIGTGISLPSGIDGDFLGNFDENGDVILSNQSLTNGDYVLYYRDEQGNLHEYATMKVVNTYAITWVVDGKTTTERVKEGDIPTFSGSTDKASDGQYTYTFTGWMPTVVAATEDITYTAVYDKQAIEVEPTTHTITWVVDGKSTTEDYKAGDTPEFKGSTDKATDDTYDYTFTGWSPAISAVTGDKIYTAQYKQSPKNWLKVVGYKTGTKLSTSQTTYDKAINNTTNGACASGLIPVNHQDTYIYVKDVTLSAAASINNVAFYDAEGNRLAGQGGVAGGWPAAYVHVLGDGVYKFRGASMANMPAIAYAAFSCGTISDDTIVTVGMEPA